MLDKKKGVYKDGHERDDVITHRKKFLRQLIAGGFLTSELAPSEEAKEAFPDEIDPLLYSEEKKISSSFVTKLPLMHMMTSLSVGYS